MAVVQPPRAPRRGARPRERGDPSALAERIERWVAEAIITPAQAEAIRQEEARHESLEVTTHVPVVAEALGFLGGALALAAGVVTLARFWDDLSTGARLAVVVAAGTLLGVAGWAVRRAGEPATDHAGSFLWVLATGCAGFAAGLVATDLAHREGADVALAVGIAAAVAGGAFWAWRPAPLQHAATLAGIAVGVGGLAAEVPHVGTRFVGLALWLLGGAWVLLAWHRRVAPAEVGYGLGAALLVAGAQAVAGAGLGIGEDLLAVATAVALLAGSVPAASLALLWMGVAGVFVAVPSAVARNFGDSGAAPAALFVVGMALIGTAVAVSRLLPRVRSLRPGGSAVRRLPLRSSRRFATGLAGALAIVAALVVVSTPFRSVPSYPSLAQSPDAAIRGTVAFVRGTGRDACLHVIQASGTGSRVVACAPALGISPDGVAWNDAGNLVGLAWTERGLDTVEVAPSTGAVVSRGLFQEIEKTRAAGYRRSDGAVLAVGNPRAGRVRLVVEAAEGARRVVFESKGPLDYRFVDAQWSPDGAYALVEDSEHRLLVVDVDAAEPVARVLATGATSPAWRAAA